MPSETLKAVQYVGSHDGVQVGFETAVRDGDPILVDKKTADELIARGDFKTGSVKAAKAAEAEPETPDKG